MAKRIWEVQQDKVFPDAWRVEAIGAEGDIFVAVFAGPCAKARAEEYAFWKEQ